jgi:hypothetical protein
MGKLILTSERPNGGQYKPSLHQKFHQGFSRAKAPKSNSP